MKNASNWLLAFGRNVQSKDGEDGIIEKIFEIIGKESRWCVELGALTGGYGSNTWNLIKNHKWSAVEIEAEIPYYEQLKKEFAEDAQVECVNEFISFEGEKSLDAIFVRTSLPKEFDLFVLDIDGNDYHVWESLKTYRPRVAVVEFNPTIPHEVSFIQPRDMSVFEGSSLTALVELAKRKGYELVAANGDNAFFVLAELFPKFEMDNSSLDAMHDNEKSITYLFQLYDGTIKIAGNKKMLWHNLPITEDNLQMLPRGKRRFPNSISASEKMRVFKAWARTTPPYGIVQRIRKSF